MALRPWRLLSLCAGVGGLDLGVRLAQPAARSVCYVEREAAAAAILVARMEGGWLHPAPVWSDLATFDPGAWRGAVDCVVSGDPCQPNSVAGRGLGDADERWLADRVVDTFDRSGARRLFRENVPGNADGQLAYFVPALERLGCRVAVGLFSAKELGFAHGRERLFIMADRESGRLGERRSEAWAGRVGHAHCGVAGLGDDVGHAIRSGDGGVSSDAWRGALGRAAADWAGSRSVELADTGCAGRRARGVSEPGSEGRQALPSDRGAQLDDASSGRRRNAGPAPTKDGTRAGLLPGGELARRPEGSGCCVANTDVARSPFGPQPEDGRGTLGQERQASGAGSDHPLLCPGPSDPRWPDIIARAPHLEPAVRRVAHGMADRVDRLRACGNGVVPLVAGYAWRALEARLAAASAGEPAVRAA